MGGITSGIAVLTRLSYQIEAPPVDDTGGLEGRFSMACLRATGKGGLHVGSVYLQPVANSELLERVALVTERIPGHWLLGCDFNKDPEELQLSKAHEIVGGTVLVPVAPTCNVGRACQSTIDFIVAAKCCDQRCWTVRVVDEAPVSPHAAVELCIDGRIQNRSTLR